MTTTAATEFDQLLTEQTETVNRLNALTSLDWTIDADAIPTYSAQLCANDSDHGPGTCWSPDMDGLCPSCAIQYLTQNLVAGSYISVDVTVAFTGSAR